MSRCLRPHLYSLLYCGAADEPHVNLRVQDPVATYALNAVTLAKSAQAAGHSFTLLTNDRARAEAVLAGAGLTGTIHLEEHAFPLDIPAHLPFRSAHHKLTALRLLADGRKEETAVLLDCDMVVLRPFAFAGGITVQEFSANILSHHGTQAVCGDLALLVDAAVSEPGWYGGGFIGGSRADLAMLADRIDAIWPRYVEHWQGLRMHGDDVLVSAAITSLEQSGVAVRHADDLTGIYWSGRTTAQLTPLAQLETRATLHLPADKEFLAARAGQAFDVRSFIANYRRHAAARRRRAIAANTIDTLRGRTWQRLPQIA